MYAAFFGLKREPFSIAPDPRYLFMSERHREALAHLLYGVSGGGGFVLLTGEIGAGKTTVCRCFLEQIPRRCNVAYIFNPKQTVEELLKSICDEFRIPCRHTGAGAPTVKDYVDALNQFLLRTHAVGQNNVLIIDEAQNLSPDLLEQLRLLTNLETHERKLLQIILIGQPELREILAQPKMEQLAQRVIARYHLQALLPDETARYIEHRMSVGGLKGELPFSRPVLARIHTLSRGVPRRINLLCDRALLGAYATRKARVDRGIVEKAAREVFDGTRGSTGTPAWRRFAAPGLGAAAVALALLAVALLYQREQAAAGTTAVATGAAAAKPPNAASGTVGAPKPLPIAPSAAELKNYFRAPQRDEPAAWRDLAALWKLPLSEADPCQAAQPRQVFCFRGSASIALLRALDRPALLTLYDDGDRPLYTLLTALAGEGATLRSGADTHTVALTALAKIWRGEFATFWRAPPGYTGTPIDAGAGPAAAWLAEQLAALNGDSTPPEKLMREAALKSSIAAFQTAQGLPADGLAGPITLMQVNRARGIGEPRLEKLP